jgi:enoyl-CoA hydratase
MPATHGIEYNVVPNGISILTVNRPEVSNALDWEAMDAFGDVIERTRKNKETRALIVTGHGDVFIAGGDLKALARYGKRKDGMRLSKLMGRTLRRMRELHCPTIAAINGPARGGGAEIAVACDIRVMAENANIGFVHASLGIAPGWGGARYLLQLVGYSRALELLATGRIVASVEAREIGLAEYVVPAGKALETAQEIATKIAAHPRQAIRAAKRLLRFALASPDAIRSEERRLFAELWGSEYKSEAIERFLGGSKTKSE